MSLLLALFYAEFDNEIGPVVLFDAPAGSMTRRPPGGGACLFDSISDFSITGPQVTRLLRELR